MIFFKVICDLLSENSTCLHFLEFPFMKFLLSIWKSQWTVEVSAISGEWFWSYSDRQQEEQNNPFVQCLIWKKITGTCLIITRVQ